MTRVTVLVSAWLLLAGSIADSAVSGATHRSALELLVLYAAITAAAGLALWFHLAPDPEAPAPGAPDHDPWHYD